MGLKNALWVLSAGMIGAGLVAAPTLAQAQYAYTGTSMFGSYEVGHDGAGEEASGDFTAEMDLENGKMCYMLEISGLEGFTAAHIHKAEKGQNGPPVVTLELASDDKCIDVDVELMKDIAKNEHKYYVNVHTEAFPQGAIRGQLDMS
ncbi:CHRD domain-containing protein [Erythrobacter sp. THAF29]|uniref:CHRD domain-containing protein n=1 Tax=Erythrobacter sp. THAF29 TaxID=2587851 RepID=UPI001268EB62|nr:CHRD domain-containing protein [Erythrobacter sp. THAF29]QFT78221.1 CHRD domain protein [Erythrobacter sp. THAF29]